MGASLCVLRIKGDDIDFDLAHGADKDEAGRDDQPAAATPPPAGSAWQSLKELLACFGDLLRQRAVVVFLVSAVPFHFANAAP